MKRKDYVKLAKVWRFMANSEGRAGGMNFNSKQLQKEWVAYATTLSPTKKDIQTFLEGSRLKPGSTACEHLNEPLNCSALPNEEFLCPRDMKR